MPEQQIAVVEGQVVPSVEINLNLNLIPADLFKGDQSRLNGSGCLDEHPALHLWGKQPFQTLELTHDCRLFS